MLPRNPIAVLYPTEQFPPHYNPRQTTKTCLPLALPLSFRRFHGMGLAGSGPLLRSGKWGESLILSNSTPLIAEPTCATVQHWTLPVALERDASHIAGRDLPPRRVTVLGPSERPRASRILDVRSTGGCTCASTQNYSGGPIILPADGASTGAKKQCIS